MDLSRTTIKLCMLGTQAEFERRSDDARNLYLQAWNSATDDYEKCIAAHYVAHLERDPEKALYWNTTALVHAESAEINLVSAFLPSLYVNLGHSYEMIGDQQQSTHYYRLAEELGLIHQFK